MRCTLVTNRYTHNGKNFRGKVGGAAVTSIGSETTMRVSRMESVWKTASFTLLRSRDAKLAELKMFSAAGRKLAEQGLFGAGGPELQHMHSVINCLVRW